MQNDLYCTLFVNSTFEWGDLKGLMRSITATSKDGGSSVVTSWGNLRLATNPDRFTKDDSSDEEDGFLFFPWRVEVNVLPGIERSDYLDGLGTLLENLWAEGVQAVAMCGFEDELPGKGGYPRFLESLK